MLSFSLDREFVDSYRSLPEPFGYNGLGAVTFYRTYSRAKDDGSQESWVDVCERVINGMYSIQKDHAKQNNVSWSDEKAQRSAQEAFDGLFNLRWSPSGRGLWLMGSDFIHGRKVSEALLNCAFISTQDINYELGSIFRWFMEMLMLGVGVGADVLGAGKVYVEKPLHVTPGKPIYIEDTRESWAESIETLVNAYLVTHDHETFFQPTFDYSKIRAKGEPIKGFGGISSGPEPLIELHDRVRKYLDANDGKLITTRTIADIFNAIGACVIAGNVRRSAEILLADFEDDEFINLKNYQLNPDRSDIAWASNNSLFAKIGSDYDKISNLILDNGEPGLAWMDNVQKFGRMGELKPDNAVGFNPCFAPGTLVHTKSGHYPIESLVGQDVDIWNGSDWQTVNNFRVTAQNQEILSIELQDGSIIRATPYHTFILEDGSKIYASDLTIGDKLKITDTPESHGRISANGAYLKGFLVGDGTSKRGQQAILWLYAGKEMCSNRLKESALEINPIVNTNAIEEIEFEYKEYGRRKLYNMTGLGCRSYDLIMWATEYKNGLPYEVFEWNKNSKLEFLAGLFDSDGNSLDTTNGFGYQLSSVSKQLLLDVQALLKTLGIQSKVSLMRVSTKIDFNDGYGEYKTKDCYRLSIAQESSVKLSKIIKFERLNDFSDKNIIYSVKPRFNKIVSIRQDGVEEQVYCCTVDGSHQFSLTCGIDVGQCVEQPLAHKESCNLVEVYMNNHTDLYEYLRTLKFAYLYGKTVTLAYDWISDDESRYIMQENRRIGLSNTGIAQFLNQHGLEKLIEWLDVGYKTVQNYDDRYSTWLKVNKSIRLTTVKPSGSVSLLSGSTPGIHHPISEYYIRRIRLQNDTKLLKYLQDCGFYTEPDFYSTNTTVVEFPVHVADGIRKESDLSIWEQLELTAIVQQYWSDNGVSVTIKVDPNKNTPDEIARSLSYYQYKLKAVSMLPAVDGGAYKQMPYEEISEEKYRQIKNNINFDKLLMLQVFMSSETVGMTDQEFELYCTSDACQIVYPTA